METDYSRSTIRHSPGPGKPGSGQKPTASRILMISKFRKSNMPYVRMAVGLLTLLLTASCGSSNREAGRTVVIYVSEDQVFSEPILKDFEKQTGIQVKAVFDTEEAKSTGVMNRLLAEKNNPQADVYWANEPVRADVLRQQGISADFHPENSKEIPNQFKDAQRLWTRFSARARVLLVNQNAKDKPIGVLAYVDPKLKCKGVIANPLFGTTTAEL